MTHMIGKMTGVNAASSGMDKLLDVLAPAITDAPSPNVKPSNWMDAQRRAKGSVAIKTNTQNELLNTMMALGFYTVSKDAAVALIAHGHKLPIAEIDAKLAKANVSLQDRIALKAAMDKYGIIGR